MIVLGLDTATDACTCGLWMDGVILEDHRVQPRKHAELILEMIHGLLLEAELQVGDLDGVAFGCGPGSFTGLRIAAGVTQGLAFGAGVPVVPVSTLHALATCAARESGAAAVLAGFDARMNEVYWGAYLMDQQDPQAPMQPCGADALGAASDIVLPEIGSVSWVGVGSAFSTFGDQLRASLGERLGDVYEDLLPHGADVAALGAQGLAQGQGVPAELAMPVYLRNQVTTPARAAPQSPARTSDQ
jgi:tRNA threonylcarbamoyladenosine biosynthesis protein TsaB